MSKKVGGGRGDLLNDASIIEPLEGYRVFSCSSPAAPAGGRAAQWQQMWILERAPALHLEDYL